MNTQCNVLREESLKALYLLVPITCTSLTNQNTYLRKDAVKTSSIQANYIKQTVLCCDNSEKRNPIEANMPQLPHALRAKQEFYAIVFSKSTAKSLKHLQIPVKQYHKVTDESNKRWLPMC